MCHTAWFVGFSLQSVSDKHSYLSKYEVGLQTLPFEVMCADLQPPIR